MSKFLRRTITQLENVAEDFENIVTANRHNGKVYIRFFCERLKGRFYYVIQIEEFFDERRGGTNPWLHVCKIHLFNFFYSFQAMKQSCLRSFQKALI